MAKEILTYGHVDGTGKLNIVERNSFMGALHNLKNRDVVLSVKAIGQKRSNAQQRYYRGVVVPLFTAAINDAWGEDLDDDEVHELLKRRFNARKIETENGVVTIAMSTTKLDTAEFTTYIERCRNWAAQFFGVDIPDPVKISTTKTALQA